MEYMFTSHYMCLKGLKDFHKTLCRVVIVIQLISSTSVHNPKWAVEKHIY